MCKKITAMNSTVALLWLSIAASNVAASIDNLNSWTQVQDPPHSGMSGVVNSATQVTLTASGAVPAGTDIGYQSIDGVSVASSSSGNYFSPSQSFHIAVDFNLTGLNSIGFAAIGFGVGEDGAGMNSSGPLMAILNGAPSGFSGAARINDVTQSPILISGPGLPTNTASGRFFVRYDSLTGDIITGVSTTPGSDAPTHAGTFSGLQNSWNDKDLLASFFLRSDSLLSIPPLTSGTVSAVFSNFEVLAGTPVSVVPLPAAVWLFGAALGGLLSFRARSQIAG